MNKIISFEEATIKEGKFNGERLKEARVYRGLSSGELAQMVGLQRATISMYENNKLKNPELSTLKNLSQALEFPIRFFMEPSLEEGEYEATYFRSLLTAGKRYREEQNVKIKMLSVIYNFLDDYIDFPKLKLPQVEDGTSPERAAEILREYWGLGTRPIENMIYLVEKNGLIVSDFETSTGEVDAYSHFMENSNGKRPLIGYSKNKNTAARIHFDIAHELGHILLHNWKTKIDDIEKEEFKKLEQQANNFAAAFLLPEDEFKRDIGNYASKLPYYVELKREWKVSIAAMIRRSYSLGLLSGDEYQRLMRYMQKQGIRKVEPLDDTLCTSKPSIMKKAVSMLIEEDVFTPSEFMQELSREYRLTMESVDVETLLSLPIDFFKENEAKCVRLEIKQPQG